MRIRALGVAVVAMGVTAGGVQAQVGWESPMLATTDQTPGIGGYLIAPAFGDLGAMLTWRGTPTLGFRGGLAESEFDGDIAFFGGVDYQRDLVTHSSTFPLDVDWLVGAGLSIGEFTVISLPAGITLGRRLDAEGGVSFTPYLTPRLVFDILTGDDPNDGTELEFVADLGLDVQFQPSWLVRFGFTLGDRGDEALAIGIHF